MSLVEKLVRSHLKALIPYSTARDEFSGNNGVFLDANENPFGSVGGGNWNRYPDPYQKGLKAAISGIKGIDSENIFLGNGSDEPIDLMIRAFCEPEKDHVLICPPTYGMYEVSSNINNVGVKKVNLTNDFRLDTESILESVNKNTKIIFICSPNNPTGNCFDQNDILNIVRNAPGWVILDEAYVDFSDEESFSRYIHHFPNLIVLHTFSKAWGMAAFRLGIAFAPKEVINLLNKIKSPYNISGLIQKSALSALLSFMKKDQWVKEIKLAREQLMRRLTDLEIVQKVYHSEANFLLVKFSESQKIFDYLISQKIIVRDRSSVPLCEGCLRITVGTEEENNKLMDMLEAYY